MTLWVTALRSGEYKQAKGSLEVTSEHVESSGCSKTGFCCLGVLSDLAVKAGIVTRSVDEYFRVHYGTDNDMSTGHLPHAVRDWAGMGSVDGLRDNAAYLSGGADHYKSSLMELNDYSAFTFAQIADVIEAEYETI